MITEDIVHAIWSQSSAWLAPPLRICLFALVVLAIVTKVLPPVLRHGGRALRSAASPGFMLLTYPEFLLTTAYRRADRRPPAAAFAYGRLLGAAATAVTACGRVLDAAGQRHHRFPIRTFVVATALVLAAWYSGHEELPPAVREASAPVRADLAMVDAWLATGAWAPPPSARATWCTPSPPAPKPKPPAKPKPAP